MIEHLCLILGAVVLLNAEETYDTKYACGNKYLMDSVKSMNLIYDGRALGTEKCEFKFTIADTSEYKICVQPISLDLVCGTTIEYQEHFVAENIHDGEFNCSMNGQSFYKENCVDAVDIFLIVIKKENPTLATDESASFHVYAEEKPKYSFGTSSSTGSMGLVALVIPIVIIVVFCIVCMVRLRRRRQKNRNTQVTYNTTVGATARSTAIEDADTSGLIEPVETEAEVVEPAAGTSKDLPCSQNTDGVSKNQEAYPQSGFSQPAVPGNPVQETAHPSGITHTQYRQEKFDQLGMVL